MGGSFHQLVQLGEATCLHEPQWLRALSRWIDGIDTIDPDSCGSYFELYMLEMYIEVGSVLHQIASNLIIQYTHLCTPSFISASYILIHNLVPFKHQVKYKVSQKFHVCQEELTRRLDEAVDKIGIKMCWEATGGWSEGIRSNTWRNCWNCTELPLWNFKYIMDDAKIEPKGWKVFATNKSGDEFSDNLINELKLHL